MAAVHNGAAPSQSAPVTAVTEPAAGSAVAVTEAVQTVSVAPTAAVQPRSLMSLIDAAVQIAVDVLESALSSLSAGSSTNAHLGSEPDQNNTLDEDDFNYE